MPFDIPTLTDTKKFLMALGKALFPGLNFGSDSSFHGKRAIFAAGAATQIHAHVDSAQRDLHPLTAGDGKPINDWGSALGVARKGATPARRSAAGRVRGNAGATVTLGRQMRHPATGLLYQINNNVTIPGVAGVDPDSFVDADVVGIDTGAQTRLPSGEVLTFLSQPLGIQANVTLQLALDQDGFDAEQYGSYRSRTLTVLSSTPSGGSPGDFQRWALESLDTVGSAYVFPNRAGRGTVDIVAFYNGTGSARTLTAPDRATVLAYIQTKAPIQLSGSGGGLRVITTVADPQRAEILIKPNGIASFAFDWSDFPVPTVLSWTAATRALRFAGGTIPAGMRAGHRLLFDGSAGGSGVNAQDGREFRIESVSSVDTVILETAPAVAPGATDKVYSGGPLVTPIRDAIVAHLNGEIVYAGKGLTPVPASSASSIIGLDILADGIGPSNPLGKYGAWSGAILLSTLFRIATYKAGVRKVTIVSPAADYEPTDDQFPLDGQIHYVTPGAIIVRSA